MSASKRVLIVGVGSIGERHVRCFLQTGRASVSIVDTNPVLRAEVAARYKLERVYDGLEPALAADHDAAVICTPAHLHVPLAIQCARRGLHLLIEKPLSVRLDRLDELKTTAHDRQLFVSVAYVLRCNPVLAAMRAALGSQRFGRPVQLVAASGQHFPTYRPAYRDIYYAHRALGGGATQDALTHVINAAEWLIGPVERLTADADHKLLEGVSVEDTVHVLTRHGNVMGSFSLNQYQAPFEITVTVVCEKGTLRFESHHHRFRWMTEPGSAWHDETTIPLERDALFVMQAERFLAALEGEPPLCSLEEGEQTLRVNLAVLAACESQTWVQV